MVPTYIQTHTTPTHANTNTEYIREADTNLFFSILVNDKMRLIFWELVGHDKIQKAYCYDFVYYYQFNLYKILIIFNCQCRVIKYKL